VWLTEHHFFDDGYLPQCWTLAAAIAARTTKVRIGTAVALLPVHSALEVAEQISVVDVISGGRRTMRRAWSPRLRSRSRSGWPISSNSAPLACR
jgi:hypothetical protein